MFVYCNNNPVAFTDRQGMLPSHFSYYCYSDGGSNLVAKHLLQAYAIGARCHLSDGVISLDMDKEAAEIKEINEYLSMSVICDAIAITACDKYFDVYNQEFLLSDFCVSYEIEEHIYAYYWATNQQCMPNLIAVGFCAKTGDWSGSRVYDATKMIDIREADVVAGGGITSQALWFGYKKGIRDIYIGTNRDPWADVR